MSVVDEPTDERDTGPGPDEDALENAAEAPAGSRPLLIGSGQSAWLAVLTLGVGVAIALSIAAIVMASGEGDGGGGIGSTGPQTELAVSMAEFSFDPASPTIVAGAVPVSVANDGSIEHNWTVLASPVSSAADIAGAEVLFELGAQPGAGADGELDLAAGSYQVICTIAGHFEAGMVGELTVE